MAPEPVGPPPGFFDDDPTPKPPKEGFASGLLLAGGILAVTILLAIRSCGDEAAPPRPRGGSP